MVPQSIDDAFRRHAVWLRSSGISGDRFVVGAERGGNYWTHDNRLVHITDFAGTTSGITVIVAQNCDLADKDLARCELRHAHFVSHNHRRTNFHEATLTENIFDDCDFSGCDFSGASLQQSKFIRCAFSSANLTGANLSGATFEDCDLRPFKRISSDLNRARFERCNMSGITLERQQAESCVFIGCDLSYTDFTKTALNDSQLDGCDLTGAFLDYVIAARTAFTSCTLIGARLEHAVLGNASFKSCTIQRCSLSAADLELAKINDCHFEDAHFVASTLRGIDIRKTIFTACLFHCADMRMLTTIESPRGTSDTTREKRRDHIVSLIDTNFPRCDFTGLRVDDLTSQLLPPIICEQFRDTFNLILHADSGHALFVRALSFEAQDEYAVVTALNAFVPFLKTRHPKLDVAVSTRRIPGKLLLIIESPSGNETSIDAAYQQFTALLAADLTPEQIARERAELNELRALKRIMQVQIDAVRELNALRTEQVADLRRLADPELLKLALRGSGPVSVAISNTSNAEAKTSMELDVTNTLTWHYVTAEAKKLGELMVRDPVLAGIGQGVLQAAEDACKGAEKNAEPEPTSFAKLRHFLSQVADVIKSGGRIAKYSAEIAHQGRRVIEWYNAYAALHGLPTI